MHNTRLWIIDAGYLFNARRCVAPKYEFDYLKLRQKIEADGTIWRAYYLNSTTNPPNDVQDSFHHWLRSGLPNGPQLITKLYSLKRCQADIAYCENCKQKVQLVCPNGQATKQEHNLVNTVQKGVDVGIATLSLLHKENYTTLILSSGDADLLDVIEYLSEAGKRIELAVFSEGVATELQCRADRIYWINDFSDEIKK